ncbi:hypothetical protein GCM10027610_025840 [Dactylosporangium cerinum]
MVAEQRRLDLHIEIQHTAPAQVLEAPPDRGLRPAGRRRQPGQWSAAVPRELGEQRIVLPRRWLPAPSAAAPLYSRLLTDATALGALPAASPWECWRPGRAEGHLIGGVINRIALVQATPFAVPLDRYDGAVLFWEELGGEASYVWTYLQVLRHAGILDRISGMVVGVPRDIAGLDASPTLADIVLDALGNPRRPGPRQRRHRPRRPAPCRPGERAARTSTPSCR